jgi:hypothetical protein
VGERKPILSKRAESNLLSSKAPERRHVDGAQPDERIPHLRARGALDNEACGLYHFHESPGKVRAERLQVGHGGGGVLVAFIEVADL